MTWPQQQGPGNQETHEEIGFLAHPLWRWLSALGAALLLGGGIWAYAQFAPDLSVSWPAWKAYIMQRGREALLWLQFFGSILLSVLALLWLTALLFSTLLALAYLLARTIRWVAARPSTTARLHRACRGLLTLLGHERWLGTAFNLAASAGALAILARASGLPLDPWDLGIQAIVTLAVELIVLGVLFGEGRMSGLSRH
jgi:hypothetical protein